MAYLASSTKFLAVVTDSDKPISETSPSWSSVEETDNFFLLTVADKDEEKRIVRIKPAYLILADLIVKNPQFRLPGGSLMMVQAIKFLRDYFFNLEGHCGLAEAKRAIDFAEDSFTNG